jgi:nucleotide-binding universal stress UspA family protein
MRVGTLLEQMMNRDSTSTGTRTRPSRILIAADLSTASERALHYAREIAPSGAEIRIVSVAENPRTLIPTGSLSASVLATAREELHQDATLAVSRARDNFADVDVRLETEVIDLEKHGGDVVRALLHCANDWHADLLVLGAHERHGWLSRWVNGTVSEPIVKLGRCPILIVPERDNTHIHHAPKRILFAIDGSDQALQALRFGLTFAVPGAQLRAVYVVDCPWQLTDIVPIGVLEDAFIEQGECALNIAQPLLESVCPGHSTTALVNTAWTHDNVALSILGEAEKWEADLIVMGTHGRRGFKRWLLGSVAGRVASTTRTPLLLVSAQSSQTS